MRANIQITNAERKKEPLNTNVSTKAQMSYMAKAKALGLRVMMIADRPRHFRSFKDE